MQVQQLDGRLPLKAEIGIFQLLCHEELDYQFSRRYRYNREQCKEHTNRQQLRWQTQQCESDHCKLERRRQYLVYKILEQGSSKRQ